MITEPDKRVIEGLGADGPGPEMREKLMLFGQFVGDWDIVEARYPQPDGTEIKRRGEIHSGWILDGRAIQDVVFECKSIQSMKGGFKSICQIRHTISSR